MKHVCNDPDCGKPHLTHALLDRLDGSVSQEDLFKALDVSLCGLPSLNAIAAKYDQSVSKAVKPVDEMVQIRKIEDKLFRASLAAYVEKANAAIIAAMSVFPKKGDKPIRRADILRSLRRADTTFFRGWPAKKLVAMNDEAVVEVYKLAQTAVLKKVMGVKGYKGSNSLVYKAIASLQVKPSFTVVDEAATEWLKGNQRFWVSSPGIWTAADDLIKEQALESIEGMLPVDAGEAFESAMQAKYGTGKAVTKSAAYWEGVIANAATTARVSGALREMEQIGVTTYQISNPMDQRTTEICQHMDGKIMQVTSATTVLDALQASGTDAKGVKKLHPWHPNDFKERFNKIGIDIKPGEPFPAGKGGDIAKAGFSFPPYHFRCRSTVDVSDEVDFNMLGTGLAATGAPGVVPVPPLSPTLAPKPVPKPKVPKKVAQPVPKPQPVAPKTPPVVSTPKPAPAPKTPPKVERPGQFMTSDGSRLDISDMTYNAGRREGGMHTKCFFTDEAGDTWMFKPYSHRTMNGIDQSFRAYGDKMAADMARALGVPTAEVQVAQLPAGHPALRGMGLRDGKPITGSIQRFARGIEGEMGSLPLSALDEVALSQVQREHVFDYLISNYDSHGANLLRTRQGVLGIDKGQVFRYFGQDSLDLAFNPNMRSYGVQTYYNQQLQKYARGEFGKGFAMSADNPATARFLKALDEMSDEQFIALVRPYFDEASEAGIRWINPATGSRTLRADDAIEQLLKRKRNIRKDVEDFYKDLNSARNKALGIKPGPAAGANKPFKEVNATFMRDLKSGNARGVATYTPANGQLRSGEILWRAPDDDGIVGAFQIHRRGWDKIKNNLGPVDDIAAAGTPADPLKAAKSAFQSAKAEMYQDTVKVAKSLNAHLVDTAHSVYDGAIPQKTWDLMKSTWTKAEQMKATAAAGSAESALADTYIKFFQKVTKSSSSTVMSSTVPTGGVAIEAITAGTKAAGFIKDPTITQKLSAVLRAKPAPKTPKAVKKPRDKFEFTVKRTNGSKAFPKYENTGSLKNPRVRWDGEEFLDVMPTGDYGRGVDLTGTKAYEVTFTKTRNPIRIVITDPDAGLRANAGRARVYIDKPAGKVTATDLKEALQAMDRLGLDTSAATLADMEARYLLKVTDQAYPNAIKGGGYAWEAGMPQLASNATAEEILDAWGSWWAKKMDVGDSFADLKKSSAWNPSPRYQQGRFGRGRWQRFDMVVDEIDDLAPFICMGDDAAKTINMMLDNGTDAFISNSEKVRYGIRMGGESPSKDVRVGGANRVFTGIFRKDWDAKDFRNSNYYNADRFTVRFRTEAMLDTDNIYYARDSFGEVSLMQTSHKGNTVSAMRRSASGGGNEMLFKQTLPLSELDFVPVADAATKKALIKRLREAGIKPASGKRWESIVQVVERR